MLYLLKSFGPSPKVYYKVGYAENLDRRFSQYEAYNPGIIKLLERPGTFEDEQLVHKYLHSFSDLEFYKLEWYTGDEDLLKKRFMESMDIMMEVLWEKRDIPELFNASSKTDQDLFHRLAEFNDYQGLTSLDIDHNPDLINNTQSEILELNKFFLENKDFTKRMCFYCMFRDQHPELAVEIGGAITVPARYHEYYEKYGTDKMKSVSYRESEFKNLADDSILKSSNLIDLIKLSFSPGKSYSNKNIKSTIQGIYDSIGYKKTAKATDILSYFECQKTNVTINGKPVHGLKLLSIK